MRRRLRAFSFFALAAVAITCTDAPTSPKSLARPELVAGRLVMTPSFSAEAARTYSGLAAFGIEVTDVHIRLTAADGSTRDTVIAFPASQATLTIEIPVFVSGSNESFTALIELRNDQGVVLFSGTQVVVARALRLPPLTPSPVTIQYTGPGRGTRTVSVTPLDATVSGAATRAFTASAVDSSGRPISDLLVRWETSDAALATVTSTGNATATVNVAGRRGSATITATTPQGIAGTSRLTITPLPARVVVVSGGAQSGVAGNVLAQPFVVEVQATDNLPAPGATVNFRAVTAGGAVQRASAVTDATGRATSTLTVGTLAGSYQFEASSGSLAPVAVTATATAAAPAQLSIVSGDAQVDSAGRVLRLPLVVKMSDQFGNGVGGATVNWTRVTGAGSIGAPSSTTSAEGLANATYTLGNIVGSETVRATAAAVAGPAGTVLFSMRATNRSASTIAIVAGGSQTGAANVTLSTPLVALVTDPLGNPVPNVPVIWGASSGGATFAPPSSTTAPNGLAATTVTLGAAAGVVTVTATTGALVATTSMTIVAGAGVTLTKSDGDGQSATVGASVEIAPSVLVKNAGGNPVVGAAVVFAVTSGGGSAIGVNATTNASGIATVGSWTLGGTAGANTLTASMGALSATFSATGTAGSASKFALVLPLPANIAVGAAIAPIQIRLVDATNNPVAQAGVSVTASGLAQPANTTLSVAATTDATGIATFTLPPYTGVIGIVTFTFSATFITSLTPASVPIVTGLAAKLLLTTQPASTATVGAALSPQPVVQITDAGDNPVSAAGVSVVVSIFSGGGTVGGTTTINTGASGQAAFTNLVITGALGPRVLDFSAATLTGARSNVVNVTAGVAANIAIDAGAGQTATVGAPVAIAPSVKVTDAVGNPVAGVVVQFTAVTAGSTVSNATTTAAGVTVSTDASGIARLTQWTLGAVVSSYTMTATVSGLTGSPVTFTANAISGLATQLAFITAPSAAAANAIAFATQPVVQLRDAQNNPVSAPGVVITMGITSGTGSLSNFTAITTASGIATFSGLAITGLAGPFNIAFVTGAITLPFGPIALSAGAATQLMISTSPSASAQVGVPFATQPLVQLGDVSGNPVSQSGVNVTAIIASGGGTVNGIASVSTNASGVAGFTNLAITGTVGSFLLRFTGGSLSSVLSSAISVSVGPGVQLAIATPPSPAATSGTVLTQQPAIQIQDAGGNSAVTAGVLITATITSGSGSLLNATATTVAGGVASFSGLTITGVSGPFVLQFGSSGYAPVNSGLIAVSGPSTLTTKVGTRVSATVAGTTNPSIAPVFAAKNGAGAPLPGVNVTLTANGRCLLDVAGLLQTTQTKATDVNGEVTPLVRLPAGAVGAGCVIRATGAFTAQTDSALLAVYPLSASHIWVGGTSTSWSTAANWIGPSNAVVAAAPSSADEAFVPSYVGIFNAPKLAAATSVRRLALDTAAVVDANATVLTIGNLGVTGFGIVINGTTNLTTTASLNGVFDKLVIGQPGSCGFASPMLATLAVVQATSLDIYCRAVVDTGTVNATDATVLPGGWLNINSRGTVIVTNNATFGGDSLTVNGTLQVNGVAQLGGSRVGIYSANNVGFNDVTFNSTAGSFSNSIILVQGNAVFGGAGAGQQNFSGGTLAVLKNFTQLTGTVAGNTGLTFTTSSDHVTAFGGTTSQAVSFADPTTSKFSIVRITNGVAPVVFNSNVQFVNGTTQPRLEVQAGGLTIPVSQVLTLGSGGWKLFSGTTTTVTGSIVSAGACQGRGVGATLTGTGLINTLPVASFSCP